MFNHTGPVFMILALDDRSPGRAALGMEIARSLVKAGQNTVLALNHSHEWMVKECRWTPLFFSNALGGKMAESVNQAISELQVDCLVFCDYFGNCNLFHRMGIPSLDLPEELLKISIDLWDNERTGFSMDRLPKDQIPVCKGGNQGCYLDFLTHTLPMTPVPIAPFHGNTLRFNAMPDLPPQMAYHRPSKGKKKVLTTTSSWQHRPVRVNGSLFWAVKLPWVIGTYLETLGDEVEWIHVGPRAFDLGGVMDGRYRWLEPMSRHALDALFMESDLFLSFNPCAGNMMRAALMGMPTVLVQNSFSMSSDTGEERAWMDGSELSYPFRLWPFQFYNFLNPFMETDSFFSILNTVEALDSNAFVETCWRLLWDREHRLVDSGMKTAYRIQLETLPDPATAILQLAGNQLSQPSWI